PVRNGWHGTAHVQGERGKPAGGPHSLRHLLGSCDGQCSGSAHKYRSGNDRTAEATVNKNSVDLLLDVIDRLPGSKLKPLAVAMHYMSEDVEKSGDLVVGYLKMLEFVLENDLRLVEEELRVRKVLAEDGEAAPTNSVTGIEPRDEPVIDGA